MFITFIVFLPALQDGFVQCDAIHSKLKPTKNRFTSLYGIYNKVLT